MRSNFGRFVTGVAITATASASVVAPVWLLAVRPAAPSAPAHVAAGSTLSVLRAAAPEVIRATPVVQTTPSTLVLSRAGAIGPTRLVALPPPHAHAGDPEAGRHARRHHHHDPPHDNRGVRGAADPEAAADDHDRRAPAFAGTYRDELVLPHHDDHQLGEDRAGGGAREVDEAAAQGQ